MEQCHHLAVNILPEGVNRQQALPIVETGQIIPPIQFNDRLYPSQVIGISQIIVCAALQKTFRIEPIITSGLTSNRQIPRLLFSSGRAVLGTYSTEFGNRREQISPAEPCKLDSNLYLLSTCSGCDSQR